MKLYVFPISSLLGLARVVRMYKVASFSIYTKVVFSEIFAFLGLVLHVRLLVFKQFMRSVSEFTPLLIGTEAEFHESAAELRFFLGFFRIYVGFVFKVRVILQMRHVLFVVIVSWE